MERGMCEMCGERGWNKQYCNGDGRLHGHGAIHTRGDGLKLVCDECAEKDAKLWATVRT